MSRRLSILVLEPNRDAREKLTKWFLREGYTVTAVCHPRQALEAATIRYFDLALIDLTPTKQCALLLVSRLRGLVRDLRVVVLSGDPEGISSEDAIEFGASALLHLPCSLEQVNCTVKQALSADLPRTEQSSTPSNFVIHEVAASSSRDMTIPRFPVN